VKKLLMAVAAVMMAGSAGAALVYQHDFGTSQGSTFTTSGQIGTSAWAVERGGNIAGRDWGARIDDGILELSNDVSGLSNSVGWVFAHVTNSVSGHFNPTLSNSAGLVTWSFNMRQIRTIFAGFDANSYGVAFVLGATSPTLATVGDGYAVVLGNAGALDPIRLVGFTYGIQSLGTATGGLITAPAPLNNPTNNYMSVSVTYDPASHVWNLYGRNDGASFADPQSGTLTWLGSATDSAHVGKNLQFSGAYWQGHVDANQTARFDNVALQAIPEPGTVGFLAVGLLGLALRRRMKGKAA